MYYLIHKRIVPTHFCKILIGQGNIYKSPPDPPSFNHHHILYSNLVSRRRSSGRMAYRIVYRISYRIWYCISSVTIVLFMVICCIFVSHLTTSVKNWWSYGKNGAWFEIFQKNSDIIVIIIIIIIIDWFHYLIVVCYVIVLGFILFLSVDCCVLFQFICDFSFCCLLYSLKVVVCSYNSYLSILYIDLAVS